MTNPALTCRKEDKDENKAELLPELPDWENAGKPKLRTPPTEGKLVMCLTLNVDLFSLMLD